GRAAGAQALEAHAVDEQQVGQRHQGLVAGQQRRDVREGYRRFIRPSRAYANVILDGEGPVEDSVTALLSRLP
ncbi:MAG TPA: hypothetical protein DCQ52_18115, partial [Acidimicrobiaceae bacterium]|nr:hypothetical protein [Acidimicrobiaceae bacterium]